MMHVGTGLLCLLGLWSCIAPPVAAQTGSASIAAEELLFLRAKRVMVRPGESLENAAVVVRAGRVVAVGTDLIKPDGAREISGEWICAAFVDPWAAVAVAPDALADGSTSASTRTVDGVDFDGEEQVRRDAVRAGVTCARIQAGATSRVGGLGAVVRIAPEVPRASAILLRDSNVSMSVGLTANLAQQQGADQDEDGAMAFAPSGPKMVDPFDRLMEVDRVLAAIEGGRNYLLSKTEYKHELEAWQKTIAEKEVELEKDAKKFKKDREKEEKDAKEKGKEFKEKKYTEDKRPQAPRYDEDNEVLGRVANGDVSLIVQSHRASELRGLLDGTAKYDRLRLIIAGGSESMSFASQLSERHIPVIVWPALLGRGRSDEFDASDLSLAGRLANAGVRVLIGSGGTDAEASRDLPLLAELAVGHGLAREKAFDALTLGAARALDVADRIGTVELGKDAELLVLDGEPLTTAGRVRYVISAGRVVVEPKE